MNRIPLIDHATAPAAIAGTLDEIQKAFGATPNMFRAVANSPAALRALWGYFGALGGGSLDPLLGEKVAVAVANSNDCGYCLAAHTALGRKAGASAAEMSAAQTGISDDRRTAAALAFALRLVESRGQVSEADVQAVREAGFDDGQIVELLAHVCLNLFTNYVNVAFAVPVDFPSVALRRMA